MGHIKLFNTQNRLKESERQRTFLNLKKINSSANTTKMPNMTGIKLSDSCLVEYEKMKQNKAKFILLKLNDKQSEIVPDEAVGDKNMYNSENDSNSGIGNHFFDEFCKLLPENGCRYAIFCASYVQNGSYGKSKKSKYMFVSWVPGGAKIRERMIHAGSSSAVKTTLGVECTNFTIHNEQDKEAEAWVEKLAGMPNVKMCGDIVSFEGYDV